jgi:hypothetical protein
MQTFIPIGTGSQSNSKCTLNSAASTSSIVNGTLTLSLTFSFAPSFTGTWPVFVAYRAFGSDSVQWNQVGSWTTSGSSQQQVAAPTFNPPGGTYGSAQSVTLTTTTSGASIRYTTDGSTPTTSTGTLYSGPINVAVSQTLKAIAYASGMTNSTVASAAYVINIASATPANGPVTPSSGTATTRTFQWPGVGSISYVLGVIDATSNLTSFSNNCMFQYMPGTSQIALTKDDGTMQPFIPIGTGSQSNSKCTLNSAASTSSIVNGTLSLNLTFSFAPSFTGTWPVFVSYRAFGSDSVQWNQVGSWTTSGGSQQQQVAAPTFNPAAGTYTSAQMVTLSTTTAGASIRYTTDGSTPTSSTGTLYSGPVNVAVSQTLKAIAYASGMTNSTVASADYVINIAGATPANGPMTPTSGTATTRTFQWPGVGSISYVLGVIDATSNLTSFSNNCMFEYLPGTNQIALTKDDGTMQQFIPIGTGSQSNSKCTLNSAASTSSIVNGTLTLSLTFSFASTFHGTWPVFVSYRAFGSDSVIWNQVGSWTN